MCTRQSMLESQTDDSKRLNSLNRIDRIRGMIIGLALGDSLGLPMEFKRGQTYTGKLFAFDYKTRFGNTVHVPAGEVSDDTEMTLALARSLIENKGYNQNAVIQAYLQWANSGIRYMGRNTRQLFKGIKTIKTYSSRFIKATSGPESTWTQSNGSLMRSSPLALLDDINYAIVDSKLTNPSSINVEVNVLYINMMKLALAGRNRNEILDYLNKNAKSQEIINVINYAKEAKMFPGIGGKTKGWVLSPFYCVILVLLYFDKFDQAMNYIISIPDSDTDTNAAIAGAFLGCILGFDALTKETITNININTIITIGDSNRPGMYKLNDFYALTEKLNQLH